MKHQTDSKFCYWINHYGCFFMDIVYWFYYSTTGKDRDYDEIEKIRAQAFKEGVISGDLNHDGDLDDPGEGEIQGKIQLPNKIIDGKERLAEIAGLNLHYVGKVLAKDFKYQEGQLLIGEFFREWIDQNKKKRSFTHFVGIDKDLKVVYDPIPNSNTVAYGKLVAVRVFEIKNNNI